MATFHIYPDDAKLVREVYQWMTEHAQQAIEDRGRFTVALSGGSTPRQLFQLMASDQADPFPWGQTYVFWGDERDVSPTHPDSNFGVAETMLLRRLATPARAVYRWITEYEPSEALADYRAKLESTLVDGIPQLDLVILGLGPEGHTASLFPRSPVLGSTDWVEHVYVSEHKSWRYTLTLPVLNHARAVAFLVTGSSKQQIVEQIVTCEQPTPDLPATMIQPEHELHWFLDEAARGSVTLG